MESVMFIDNFGRRKINHVIEVIHGYGNLIAFLQIIEEISKALLQYIYIT